MSFEVVIFKVTPRSELPPFFLNLLEGLLGLMKFGRLLHDIPNVPGQGRRGHEILSLRIEALEFFLDIAGLEMSFAFGAESFEAGGEGGSGAGADFSGLLGIGGIGVFGVL